MPQFYQFLLFISGLTPELTGAAVVSPHPVE
jgi:hypothetical protein